MDGVPDRTPGELHARAGELFLALRALPPEERAAALERTAGDDDALRAEVLALLAHDSADVTQSGATAEVELPERIGPYRVLRRIGTGGSGQVFLAEQTEPVRRTVAIKVVPAAATSPELAARFQVERHALARAEHPHVARILDAGSTPTGLPYLVMEYVDGPPITAYCEQSGLGLVERVHLFLDVVNAVQYAHQRGVIHRDLKPGNVLVTAAGGRPSPRVLDFGIAKPIAGAFGGDSPPTSGLPIGTPAYMAPEQTRIGIVDTRVDVYALGALLYELVAGRPPIDVADPVDFLRQVRETRPEPASRVRARAAAGRDAAPRALLADLDVVLGKALEKDPGRRFQSAAELGADLERVLARRPIEARPPTLAYRAARFAERNRALTALSALALCALALGVVGLARGLRESRKRTVEVARERDVLDALNRFLIDDIILASSPDRSGPQATAQELLELASERIDERLLGRPLVAAAVHQAVANAFAELGSLDAAARHAARALELRIEHDGPDAPDTVRSEIHAASILTRRQDFARAEPALERALDTRDGGPRPVRRPERPRRGAARGGAAARRAGPPRGCARRALAAPRSLGQGRHLDAEQPRALRRRVRRSGAVARAAARGAATGRVARGAAALHPRRAPEQHRLVAAHVRAHGGGAAVPRARRRGRRAGAGPR